MPFFSVIIPLYNKENFIKNTLRSVFAQTFTDFEIIIIDNGSTDKSAAIVHSFNDSRINYITQENQGVSVARNTGIELAAANYISFLDADDYWYPSFLETMHQNIVDFPEQKVFSAAIEVETEKNVFPAQYHIAKTGAVQVVDYFDASSKESVIWTSCAVFHSSVFEKAGTFDPSLKRVQDTDLWIRVGLDFSVVFCRKILARYVFDSGSLTKNHSYTTEQLNFRRYEELAKTNKRLKKFLDLNRFSLAIKSKLNGNAVAFDEFYQAIELKNLNLKKRFLLCMPRLLLRFLIGFQKFLANSGLLNSVFK